MSNRTEASGDQRAIASKVTLSFDALLFSLI